MKISILCSSKEHLIYPYLELWAKEHIPFHEVEVVDKAESAKGGDILFMISCTEIVGSEIRTKYKASLVIHESDLPEGRGWSPFVWQILEGKNIIPITLFEAEDKVDSGAIWTQRFVKVEEHELVEEINQKLFSIKLELMDFAVNNLGKIRTIPQQEKVKPTYYSRRTPEDSILDPYQSIASQFNLIRIADDNRYPACFDLHGYRYKIKIIKMKKL